jgi:hypothetical protein
MSATAIRSVTPMVLHLSSMATKHRRIALTADPELEAAIGAARRELGDLPESRLVRELALRGSRDLEPDRAAKIRAEFEAEGVEWPEQSMAEALTELPPLGPVDPDDPYRATRILNELREDTV